MLKRRLGDMSIGGLAAGALASASPEGGFDSLCDALLGKQAAAELRSAFSIGGAAMSREPQPSPRLHTGAEGAGGSGVGSSAWLEFCKWGLPSDEHVLVKRGFCASLNYRTRIPNWVAEHLTNAPAEESASRERSKFRQEEVVPSIFRASNSDYRDSDFSRGHLAPAAAHKHTQAEF